MCLEVQGRKADAFGAYISAVQHLTSISTLSLPTTTFLDSPSSSGNKSALTLPNSTSSFESHREVHRWLSTSLLRASILSASGNKPDMDQTLRILRTYHLVARCWPSGFKMKQRGFMMGLYLRGLHARFPGDEENGSKAGSESGLFLMSVQSKGATGGSKVAVWNQEVREAIQSRQGSLSETTKFPRAGEVNHQVESFMDDCVSLWERGGCGVQLGRDVTQILWWGMSLTFHSQSLLRHLTRLLQATGSHSDAKRTFELYVQLVLKARQTAQPDVSLKLQAQEVHQVHQLLPPVDLVRRLPILLPTHQEITFKVIRMRIS